MPYYRQDVRMGRFPAGGQRFGPPQMARQRMEAPRFDEFSQPGEAFYPSYPFHPRQGQQFNPYPQAPNSRYGGLSDNLNTMMGHVGTITNGINMMRQVGAMLSLFR
ncbi:hypothetical protein ACTHOQ_03770 [Solibacillus silvestris]|uniref:hypothetical protein n=1 Tax=Solibacillus silvestris TaxID=76853 RepID=UPI003F7D704B